MDGVRRSLDDAAANPHARPWYRAIYADGTPVGFVMLADDVPAGATEFPWRYFLWRFLIGERFQGLGYGRAALDPVVAYVRTCPGAESLMTSFVPGDGSPLGFYLKCGFEQTGELFGSEEVLRLRL